MGISTVQSYRGAQIFEAVGLGRRLVDRYFTGTVSRVGGLELPDLHDEIAERHARRVSATPHGGAELDPGGEYQQRPRGEHHAWNPDSIVDAAARRARRLRTTASARTPTALDAADPAADRCAACSSSCPAAEPLPLDEVEPSAEIVKRFATGAMSLGSISPGGARDARASR